VVIHWLINVLSEDYRGRLTTKTEDLEPEAARNAQEAKVDQTGKASLQEVNGVGIGAGRLAVSEMRIDEKLTNSPQD
jgi:hypothetical protein